MFKINEDKLTPYDSEVLTMTRLAPEKWSLGEGWMHCSSYGNFQPSLLGFGLKPVGFERSPAYRKMSWRGQVLMKREYDRIVVSAVGSTPHVVESDTFADVNPVPPPRYAQGGYVLPSGLLSSQQSKSTVMAKLNKQLAQDQMQQELNAARQQLNQLSQLAGMGQAGAHEQLKILAQQMNVAHLLKGS